MITTVSISKIMYLFIFSILFYFEYLNKTIVVKCKNTTKLTQNIMHYVFILLNQNHNIHYIII